MKGRTEDVSVRELFGEQLDNDMAPLLAAAHELKTPLAVVAHLVASLRDTSTELTPELQTQYLERISLTTERMSRLVEGFTQAYRLGDERQLSLLGLEPVNVVQTTEDVLHELSPLARQLGQQIHFDARARQPLAIANKQLLTSVLINLVDNALKHNQPGSMVDLRIYQQGNHVRSSVRDNGAELSRKDLLTLRGRFGKELQPLSGRSHSSGLGLYIANQLTRAMGGQMGAVCHHKTGATFFVDLQRSTQLSLL
jgi:signal transduction histidine kinase